MFSNNDTLWNFDISAFMVLIGGEQESNYRCMQRSLFECLCPAPVAGLQTYVQGYEHLYDLSTLQYFSPSGGKSAPLRNLKLASAFRQQALLRDGQCRYYRIPSSQSPSVSVTTSTYIIPRILSTLRMRLWSVATWAFATAIIFFLAFMGDTSWIGYSTFAIFSGWSIIVRSIEYYCIRTSATELHTTSGKDKSDAVYFLGRRNSVVIIEGSRLGIKQWTGLGLELSASPSTQWFLRLGSLCVLLYTFVTIPNGTTWDQVAFILLNILGQVNVMAGQWLNAEGCLRALERVENKEVEVRSRTDVWAFLIREFGNGDWIDKADLLPSTEIWRRWRARIGDQRKTDPKSLYDQIVADLDKEKSCSSGMSGESHRVEPETGARR